MLAALADRERSLRSVQSGAIMEYSAADGHHFRTHEEIALARPASMRVEAVAPFGATMVLAADDAGRLMIFDPSKNVLMSGGANAATLERYVRIPLAPPAAVDLLMGLAPDPAELATPPDSVSDTEGMTVALWHLADGGTRELGFTAGQLAMVRERDSAGAQRYEVRYSDWRDTGGIELSAQGRGRLSRKPYHAALRGARAQHHARARAVRADAGAGHQADFDRRRRERRAGCGGLNAPDEPSPRARDVALLRIRRRGGGRMPRAAAAQPARARADSLPIEHQRSAHLQSDPGH